MKIKEVIDTLNRISRAYNVGYALSQRLLAQRPGIVEYALTGGIEVKP